MSTIVVFTNDGTGTQDYGNYDVQVFINETRVHLERVMHSYRGGWEQQVVDLADQLRHSGAYKRREDSEKS